MPVMDAASRYINIDIIPMGTALLILIRYRYFGLWYRLHIDIDTFNIDIISYHKLNTPKISIHIDSDR